MATSHQPPALLGLSKSVCIQPGIARVYFGGSGKLDGTIAKLETACITRERIGCIRLNFDANDLKMDEFRPLLIGAAVAR